MLTVLHVSFVFATGALVLYSDEQGLLWMLGKRETLSLKKLEWLHMLVGLGLAGLIATGGLLFLRAPSFYIGEPQFIVKMIFVLTLVVNSFFIGRFTHVATERAWRDLSNAERLSMLISGGVSFLAWVGAALGGLFIGG